MVNSFSWELGLGSNIIVGRGVKMVGGVDYFGGTGILLTVKQRIKAYNFHLQNYYLSFAELFA